MPNTVTGAPIRPFDRQRWRAFSPSGDLLAADLTLNEVDGLASAGVSRGDVEAAFEKLLDGSDALRGLMIFVRDAEGVVVAFVEVGRGAAGAYEWRGPFGRLIALHVALGP
jgi:hypothetical protein